MRYTCLLRPDLHAAIRVRGDVENPITEMYAGHGQRWPLLGQAGVQGVGVAFHAEVQEQAPLVAVEVVEHSGDGLGVLRPRGDRGTAAGVELHVHAKARPLARA